MPPLKSVQFVHYRQIRGRAYESDKSAAAFARFFMLRSSLTESAPLVRGQNDMKGICTNNNSLIAFPDDECTVGHAFFQLESDSNPVKVAYLKQFIL